MAIEKSLYQAPVGLGQLAGEEPDIEIEIEDPEALRLSVEGEEIFSMDKEDTNSEDFDENLAEVLDEGTLQQLAGDLVGDIDNDLSSRKDWSRCTKMVLRCLV